MSISVSAFAQRLAFINAQSREIQDVLRPRISDRAFWQFVSVNFFVTSSETKTAKR